MVPRKRKRCGECGKPGHNKRTCNANKLPVRFSQSPCMCCGRSLSQGARPGDFRGGGWLCGSCLE